MRVLRVGGQRVQSGTGTPATMGTIQHRYAISDGHAHDAKQKEARYRGPFSKSVRGFATTDTTRSLPNCSKCVGAGAGMEAFQSPCDGDRGMLLPDIASTLLLRVASTEEG